MSALFEGRTPGRWNVERTGENVLYIKAGEKIIAIVAGLEDGIDNDARRWEQARNADTLASSPMLIEKLNDAHSALVHLLLDVERGIFDDIGPDRAESVQRAREVLGRPGPAVTLKLVDA